MKIPLGTVFAGVISGVIVAVIMRWWDRREIPTENGTV